MALTNRKSINLTSTSTIEGKTVASFGAQIQEDGTVSLNFYVSDHDLYDGNKEAVRADMKAFLDYYFAQEDKL